MKSKIGLFLLALSMSASYAVADNPDDSACIMDCHVKYQDCMSRGYYTWNYCQSRMSTCSATCEGSYGGSGPLP